MGTALGLDGFFGFFAVIIIFWVNTNSHMNNNQIHVTPETREKLIILLDDFAELENKVNEGDKDILKRMRLLEDEIKDLDSYVKE